MYSRSTTSVICALTVGCHGLTDPRLPSGAERYTPPVVYERWWAMTEACSGIARPFGAVEFYIVPQVSSVPDGAYGDVAAYWSSASNRIVLAGYFVGDGRTVRHEMLHALLGTDGHSPDYFQGSCAGVVDCATVGCQDAGPAPVHAPDGAPALPLSALDVRIDLLQNTVSRTGVDTVVSVIVRVTNPRAGPVWVTLEPTPSVPGAPAYTGFFGFDIRSVGSGASLLGMRQSVPSQPVPFASGETRQFIFDVGVTRYPTGDYVAIGFFNARQVSATLRVTP